MNATSARCNASTSPLATAFWLLVSLVLLLVTFIGLSEGIGHLVNHICNAIGGQ